jgi:hypothetical protein
MAGQAAFASGVIDMLKDPLHSVNHACSFPISSPPVETGSSCIV